MVGYRRRSPDTIASLIAGLSCVAALLCCYEAGSWFAAGPSGGSRALLGVADYGAPPDISYSSAQKFAVIFYLAGILYCLLGFAIVCEEYFVASLLVLGEKFQLSDDVNGATLMAAGSSMPEVFSSLVSLFSASADNSLGMATVVGSSVYNILVIIGWSAIAGKDILLDWKPLFRDSLFYFITIIYLIVAFSGGCPTCHPPVLAKIGIVKSLIAMSLYALYVYFMTKNGQVFAKMDELARLHSPYLHGKTLERLARKESLEAQASAQAQAAAPADLELVPITHVEAASPAGEESADLLPAGARAEGSHGEGEHDELAWPKDGSGADKLRFCIKAPIVAVFRYTIPNCKEEKWKNYYWWTFATAIVWIGILAYYMVEWAQHCSCIMKVPAIIIGLTVLAAGTSLPDTLSSVVVARKGLGDMAVANAIGSNVFNVLFGLGMPWTVFIIFSAGKPIQIDTSGLLENAFTMLAVGMFYMTTFTLRGFHMTSKLGRAFIGIYALYCLQIVVRYRNKPISAVCTAEG